MRLAPALLFVLACSKPADTAPTVTLPSPASSPVASASGSLQPPPPAATYAWRWDDRPPDHHASEGAIDCTFTYDRAASLARTACASGGSELWHHDETGEFVADAALALRHGTLYSARFSDIATGCTLHAFDARTGAERWHAELEGVGPIAHSKYRNRVHLEIIDGVPVVFGWESGGRYVEARDPATGAQRQHTFLGH